MMVQNKEMIIVILIEIAKSLRLSFFDGAFDQQMCKQLLILSHRKNMRLRWGHIDADLLSQTYNAPRYTYSLVKWFHQIRL